MAYDVSEHPLLGVKGKQLVESALPEFEEQQAIAVQRLRLLEDTAYTSHQLTFLNRAIALQINWQLQLPLSSRYYKQESSSHSKQNVTYRDLIPLVNPEAADIVAGILDIAVTAAQWGDCTSVRRAVR